MYHVMICDDHSFFPTWWSDNYINIKVTNEKRINALSFTVNRLHLTNTLFIEFAEPIYDNLDQFIDDAIENGEEGVVLKRKDGLFIPDKRPAWNWIKFKIEDEYDVLVIGFESPKKVYKGKEIDTWRYWESPEGKLQEIVHTREGGSNKNLVEFGFIPVTKPYYNDWIGSLLVGVYKDGKLTDIGTVSSGLTDELREKIKNIPDNFLGRPLAVKCMQVYEETLRHPVLERWRDDLKQEDCTWEKIFD